MDLSLLPEKPMAYRGKSMKKKKHISEDPFKDIEESKNEIPIVFAGDSFHKNIVKIEDIEITVDCETIYNTIEIKNHSAENGQSSGSTENEGNVGDDDASMDSDVYPNQKYVTSSNFICDLCNLVFCNANTLRSHKTRIHSSYKSVLHYKCEFCDMAYDKKPSLVAHRKRKHNDNTVEEDTQERICNLCPRGFIGMGRLKMHMQRKHGLLNESFKHECPYCGLSYEKYSSLAAHMQRKHTEKEVKPKIFNCPFCPKLFTLRESLTAHLKRKHKAPTKTAEETDDKSEELLENGINENRHYLMSSGEMKNNVTENGQGFETNENEGSIEQYDMHTDVYPNQTFLTLEASPTFICDICNLVFSNPNTLRTHKTRIHSSFKTSLNYKCEFCDMAYDKRPSLVVHRKRKHGDNSVVEDKEERICDLCSLAFVGMSRLKMHMQRKHGLLNESFKHECPYCGLSYEKYTSLAAHMQRKHTEKEKIPQMFNCPFCPKLFTLKESLMTHVKRKHKAPYHTAEESASVDNKSEQLLENRMNENGDYVCTQCPLTFLNIPMLKIHLQRTHDAFKDSFKLKCNICNLSYDKVSSLKRHIKRKHDKTSYCSSCQKQFDTYDLYLNHSHQKQILECALCDMIFATHRSYSKHMNVVHYMISPQNIFCDQCSEGFSNERTLRLHILNKHTNYSCTNCDKTFKSRESYRRHVTRIHASNECKIERNCHHCDKKFDNERELCNHIDVEHSKVQLKDENAHTVEQYQCTKCSNSYSSWELLKSHNNMDHSSTMHMEVQCQMCGLLMLSEELSKHIQDVHKDVLKCQYCDYEAKSKVSLTKHLLRHKDISPLKCDVGNCTYSTFRPSVLERHKRNHEEAKYQCPHCPFKTTNKYTIKYHELEHTTGKKHYVCDRCDYSTSAQANLVQHKNKHLDEKKFKCDECPFASKYNTSLRFHIKKKHCDLPIQ